jgi:hypothetical protein
VAIIVGGKRAVARSSRWTSSTSRTWVYTEASKLRSVDSITETVTRKPAKRPPNSTLTKRTIRAALLIVAGLSGLVQGVEGMKPSALKSGGVVGDPFRRRYGRVGRGFSPHRRPVPVARAPRA